MSQLPGNAIRSGMLVVDERRVSKVVAANVVFDQAWVELQLRDQMTGEAEDRDVRWNGRLDVTEGLTVELEGPNGKCGSVTVELAAPADDEGRLTYKHIIRDEHEQVLEEGTDFRSGVNDTIDNERMMCCVLSFLDAAGDAYAAEMGGRKSENGDLFSSRVCEWAYQNASEIQAALLDLGSEIGVEQ